MARILAIDLGDKRIGLAVSDPTGTIASPAGHLMRRSGKRPPLTEILERAATLEVTEFVVGLPLDENGDDMERTTEARRFALALETRSGRPVRLLDERFTTAAALRAIREMGGRTRNRAGDVDALAATVLLQYALAMGKGSSTDHGTDD